MPNPTSLSLLLVSTATIAVIHALAPDHWLPFVSIGRAQKWSRAKLVWVTFLSGLGHVGSSIAIGAIGLVLGFSLTSLEGIESQRAEVAGLLLVGFGLAYAVWGLKQVRRHQHRQIDPQRTVTLWTLFAIFVLGPCEPLIPIMFISAANGWIAVALVSACFGVITLAMMIGQVLLVDAGVGLVRFAKLEHFGHTLAGLVIAVTVGMVMFLGI
jgi:sulfite exporter TauE/SafE